ncbi:MAG: FtsX-like permease family protein, partial [Propionibacteriaceae bacterium]|nr:FtsX-like permease family protein [Propionibacteriaceae bacterium]
CLLAIALGVAVMSGAAFARASLSTTLKGAVDALASAGVYVMAPGTTVADLILDPGSQQPYFDVQILSIVANVQEAKASLPLYVGAITLDGKDGQPITGRMAPSIGLTADPNQVQKGRLVSGELPQQARDIALEENTAKLAGLKVGDTTSLVAASNGSALDVTVTGIVSYDTALGGSVVAVLNGIAARSFFSPSSMVGIVAVQAADGVPPEQTRHAVEAAVSTAYRADVVLGSDARAAAMDRVDESLSGLDAILCVGAGLALLAAGFLVFSLVRGSYRSRASDIATLRALGATPGRLLGSAVGQGAAAGLAGTLVGWALGLGLAAAVNAALAARGLDLTFGVPWLWLAVSLVAGIAVALVAAWLGARGTLRQDPATLAAGTDGGRAGIGVARAVIGLLLMAGGVALAVLFAVRWWYVGAGVAVLAVGTVLASPVLVALLTRLFAPVLGVFARLAARIAKSYVLARPRRAANVAGIFVVGVALVTGLTMYAASAQATREDGLDRDVAGDFVVRSTLPNGVIPDPVSALIRQVPGIQVTAYGLAPARMEKIDEVRPGDPGKNLLVDAQILFAPQKLFASVTGTTIVEGTAEGFVNAAAVNKAFADAHGLKVGGSLNLVVAPDTAYETHVTVPIGLIIDSVLFRDIVVPQEWLAAPERIPGPSRAQLMPATGLLIAATDPTTRDDAEKQITKTVDQMHVLTIEPRGDFVQSADPWAGRARVAAYVLLGLTILAGFVGLVTWLGPAAASRRREYAVLRAQGAMTGQLRNTVRLEALLIAVAGTVIGLALGVGAVAVIQLGLGGLIAIPWLWIVGLLVGSIVLGLVAGSLPAARAGR